MKLNLYIYGVLAIVTGCNVNAGAADTRLAGFITKYAKEYKVEREVLSCVLKVESSYKLNVVSNTKDYGISQINEKTAYLYSFSLNRLTTDLGYSVMAGAIVLSDYRRVFRDEEIVNWVGRYNIGYQALPVAGTPYQNYANKVAACIKSGEYL